MESPLRSWRSRLRPTRWKVAGSDGRRWAVRHRTSTARIPLPSKRATQSCSSTRRGAPTAKETDKSIQQTGVPDDINIVKIDFDNANDLRKEYGVTQQHTFVLIGADGEEIKKVDGYLQR